MPLGKLSPLRRKEKRVFPEKLGSLWVTSGHQKLVKMAITRREKKTQQCGCLDRFDTHLLSKSRLPAQALRERTRHTVSSTSTFPLDGEITAPRLAKQWSLFPRSLDSQKILATKECPLRPLLWLPWPVPITPIVINKNKNGHFTRTYQTFMKNFNASVRNDRDRMKRLKKDGQFWILLLCEFFWP